MVSLLLKELSFDFYLHVTVGFVLYALSFKSSQYEFSINFVAFVYRLTPFQTYFLCENACDKL